MSVPTRRGPSPWDQFRELRDRMDELLGSALGTLPRVSEWSPPVNVEDTGREILVTAELPGMKKEDINIELENNVLTIRGEKKLERKETDDSRRYVYERQVGQFTRSFTLPQMVAADRIHARYENGILTITLPKSEEARPKQISVE
ncbi:MAG TPA: Hsp20/alpha crystallin family protein [Longimicrobiales bacterium]|nr:Hsp20/alpha crystallin family protein [Longimicrobiales bacterium]